MQNRQIDRIIGSLVPVAECELYTYGHSMKCTMLSQAKIDDNTGLIRGYLRVSDISAVGKLLIGVPGPQISTFRDISKISHTYTDKCQESALKLKIGLFTFHQVDITRYRDSGSIFCFIGRVTVDNLEAIKKLINGGSNEQRGTGKVEGSYLGNGSTVDSK